MCDPMTAQEVKINAHVCERRFLNSANVSVYIECGERKNVENILRVSTERSMTNSLVNQSIV